MSQNRNTHRGPHEKPGEKTKYSDACSSNRTKTGTDAESSDKMDVHGDESKSGSSKVGESNKKKRFLFKMELTANDVNGDTLFFPYELVSSHFHPAERISKEKLDFVDINKISWSMTLTYSPEDHRFVITSKWKEFIQFYSLEVPDLIRFYRIVNPQQDNNFIINYVRFVVDVDDESDTPETDDECDTPETDDEEPDEDLVVDLMFKLRLEPKDMGNRIAIPDELVLKHFPKMKKPTEETVAHDYYFTDDQKKDWCMKTMFNLSLDGYVIMDGWKGFVKEHKLKDTDVIWFYEPAQPSHTIHFLLVIVTKEEVENLWGDHADESDEEQGGMSESAGSNNQMEIDD
ncbi:AP2/ERF and B3 domain-containing transcription factor [Camellia lanceoleosa]|uniref:AP2/ERF and B3 domain-containing transcription factor n=1 Tax=Camellia lanceoleosa TaxID=1840588 RepID=A0ACC0G601_9ERIC|nr:AP2/ERF and B3 domain-containing transcription factor [Camellia lanceoleosa]